MFASRSRRPVVDSPLLDRDFVPSGHFGEETRERIKIMNLASLVLTPDDIRDITGYRIASKQIYALALMDIPFKVRPDGTPFVVRSSVEVSAHNYTYAEPEPVVILI